MWGKIKDIWARMNRWHRLILLFMAVNFRVVPGGQVGFRCNDPALSYPFTGDTISWKMLLTTTTLVPLIIMLFTERKFHKEDGTNYWPKRQALFWYKEYLFGLLLNLTIIQLLKVLIGSPRPHFFDTCMPEEALTCKGTEYVAAYTCTKAHWLTESNKSFPSGHSSIGLHSGLFIAYYLYRRTHPRLHPLVVVMQALCVLGAVFCGVSRMIDHRHHWWDVLAGAVVAGPVLSFTIQTLCKDFECSVRRNKVDSTLNNGTNLVDNST